MADWILVFTCELHNLVLVQYRGADHDHTSDLCGMPSGSFSVATFNYAPHLSSHSYPQRYSPGERWQSALYMPTWLPVSSNLPGLWMGACSKIVRTHQRHFSILPHFAARKRVAVSGPVIALSSDFSRLHASNHFVLELILIL